MDEQLKALLEGINALKNYQEETKERMENMQRSQEETKNELKERMEKGEENLRNTLEKKINSVEEKITLKIAVVNKKIEKKVGEEIEKNKEQIEERIKEQVEERIKELLKERIEGVVENFSLISQRMEDLEKKLLSGGNENKNKIVPVSAFPEPGLAFLVHVTAFTGPVKLSTYDGKTN
ncbi:uncharacterized protein TNCV_913301 [Trichonephila clavipes]|nr:uncharacterized protein TNCV_913301 [Trichonephila clavipes]